MNQGRSVFSQILSLIDYNDFRRYVRHYDGDRSVRRLNKFTTTGPRRVLIWPSSCVHGGAGGVHGIAQAYRRR